MQIANVFAGALIIAWVNNKSVEQSPSSEGKIRLDGQDIPCPLWNPKIHYTVLKTAQH